MGKRLGLVHVVTYRCEQCSAIHSREVTAHSDGLCRDCGFPMRIDDVFSDRRIVTVPVLIDRRRRAADSSVAA